MNIFSLIAKLTLDTTQFDSALQEAQRDAEGFDVPDDNQLELDTDPFDSALQESQSGADNFKGPDEQELVLDPEDFDTPLEESQSEADSFEGPDEQELVLDNDDFNQKLEESETKGQTFAESIGSIFNELKGVIAATGVVALVGQLVGSLKEGVNLARQHGDTIDKQSQKLHLTAQAYQELDYAMQLSGASVDDLTRAMRTFDEIHGGKASQDQLDYFKKLGVNVKDSFGDIKDAQSLMEETMYALADYTGSDRGLIMEAFFGKNSAGLNALLNSGSDRIKEMREEAHQLGLIMTDEEVKNAADYNDAVTRLDGALNGIKEAFASEILPLLTDAANTVAKIVAFFNPRNKQETLSEQWIGDDKELASDLKTIEHTSEVAQSLADKLIAMGDTSKMTADQYAIWKGVAEELIGLVPRLGDVIDTETGQINGNTDSIKENIKQWENLAKQKAVQALKEEKYADILSKNKELINQSVEATKKAADAEATRVDTISELNDKLTTRGYSPIDANADWLDVSKRLANIQASLGAEDTDFRNYLIGMQESLNGAYKDAKEAQDEADKLQAELDKASQEYADWVATVDTMFGTANESAEGATTKVANLVNEIAKLPDTKTILIDVITSGGLDGYPSAKGVWDVPYDNYPILAHRGERLLTASQARNGSGGSSSDAIVSAIQSMRNDLQNMKLIVGQRVFGRTVVDYGGNRMNNYIGETENRAAAGYGT